MPDFLLKIFFIEAFGYFHKQAHASKKYRKEEQTSKQNVTEPKRPPPPTTLVWQKKFVHNYTYAYKKVVKI